VRETTNKQANGRETMTTTTEKRWLTLSWTKDGMIVNTLYIIGETAKAYHVKDDFGLTCWIPKSGIKPDKPGVPTYENCYHLADWFRNAMTRHQERVITPGN
jgi:hypothetical protein